MDEKGNKTNFWGYMSNHPIAGVFFTAIIVDGIVGLVKIFRCKSNNEE